jgi:molybdopterin-guanine dinucleotide biosynthesis protein A
MDRSADNLTGLILVGGRSERMGRDKGLLIHDGETLIARMTRALASACSCVLVSVRPEQARMLPYSTFDLVLDDPEDRGPVAGLLAAWARVPGSGLLVVAVDMPLVDERLLRCLLRARAPDRIATAFEHADGTLEPLCTIWEPAAQPILRSRARNSNASLRRVLESSTIVCVTPPDPASIRSVNTPQEYAALRGRADL